MPSNPVDETSVVISAYVPRDLEREFRERAERDDRSLSAQIRRAMRLYLDTEDQR